MNKFYKKNNTAKKFHNDNNFVRGIMGPVGSGKSVACCLEIFLRGAKQAPNNNGVRKTRWVVIRNTYPELKSTTIKTWVEWFPSTIAPVNWGAPITSRINCLLSDDTTMFIEVLFLSLNRPEDIKKLLSLDLTGGWINECREIQLPVFNALRDRVGRYPPKNESVLTWCGIILDTNPPNYGHWYYKMSETIKPKDFSFYYQPPALFDENDPNKIEGYDAEGNGYVVNKDAENIDNLHGGGDYWLRSIGSKTRLEVQVYQQGMFGQVITGRPVYPEYNNDFHYSDEKISYNNKYVLFIGWDFGLTPACVFFQKIDAVIYIISEMTSNNMGITQFGELVKKHIEKTYGPLQNLKHKCGVDPAGNQRSQTDEKTCIDVLKKYGFKVHPAPSQNPTKRREAVAEYLRYRHNEKPRFQINKTSPVLLQGFLGGYNYKKIQISGTDDVFKETPDKNNTSHIHDALQYGMMIADLNSDNVRKKRVALW